MPHKNAADPDPGFRHRRENFGIIASICVKCFATVARSKAEEDLAHFERTHVCNPHDLERFKSARMNASKPR
jgi:hypothetical protein